MKSIYKYIFSFISVFSLYNPISGIETPKRTLSDQNLLALTAVLNDMTFSTLINIMYDLEDTINYWEKQPKNKRSYTIFRPSQELDHITALKQIEQIHAKALGNLHILRHTKNLSAKQYCLESLDIVSTLTNIPVLDNKPAHENLKEKLTVAINKMSTYKKCFDAEIYVHTKPSHFARNWWKYVLGTAAISALGFTAYEFKHDISRWCREGMEALQQQWQQRIVIPIKGITRNLLTNQNDLNSQEMETQQTIINQTTKNLNIKKESFKKETYTYYQRRPDISSDQINDRVARLLSGDDTDVMHDLMEQTRNIINNIFYDSSNWIKSWIKKPAKQESNFRILETIMLLLNFYKLKVDEKELEIHKIKTEGLKAWYLQEINAMLGAMFPAALTGYAAYKISTHAFSTLFFKKVILIPLQERILSIRKMLNRFDDGEQKELSDEMTGHLVYWTQKLRQYIIQIPDEQQENFKQDIKELESIQLTIKQKHEVVKRMYDVYGFLKFHD